MWEMSWALTLSHVLVFFSSSISAHAVGTDQGHIVFMEAHYCFIGVKGSNAYALGAGSKSMLHRTAQGAQILINEYV